MSKPFYSFLPTAIILLALLVTFTRAAVSRRSKGLGPVDTASPHLTVEATHDGYNLSQQQQYQQQASIPPPSPKCWKSAATIFHRVQQSQRTDDAQELCNVMPEHHLKALALEIARCHLKDLGKPLFYDRGLLDQCLHNAYQDTAVLSMCLQHLTDAGVYAYTHYVSYVQQLCTRLTAEQMVAHQHETAQVLAARSTEQLQALTQLSQEHTTAMQALSEIPRLVQEQLTTELQEQFQETVKEQLEMHLQEQLQEQLQDGLGHLLHEQATQQASFLEDMLENIKARENETKENFDVWTHYQTSLWQNQAREMDRQRTKMQQLSEAVSTTAQTMQPIVHLQALVTAATQGYTYMTLVLHFLGTFNLVWLVTRPHRCRRFRGYLFGIVVTEAVLELSLSVLTDYQVVSERERVLVLTQMRRWALLVECGAYVAGLLATLFGSRYDASGQEVREVEPAVEEKFTPIAILPSDHPVRVPPTFVSTSMQPPLQYYWPQVPQPSVPPPSPLTNHQFPPSWPGNSTSSPQLDVEYNESCRRVQYVTTTPYQSTAATRGSSIQQPAAAKEASPLIRREVTPTVAYAPPLQQAPVALVPHEESKPEDFYDCRDSDDNRSIESVPTEDTTREEDAFQGPCRKRPAVGDPADAPEPKKARFEASHVEEV